ncbi:MAG: EAL domain-containing protein [Rhodocyclales bacterium]|nr:EAL domain-containing protein [Rhodocyclales bacterium]
MLRGSETLVRHLARAALLGITLLPALVYLFTAYSSSKQMISDDAKVQAKRANTVIAANPEVWRYVSERVIDQIAVVRHEQTRTVLIDANGNVLAAIGTACRGLCIADQAQLLDFGSAVGELRVEADLTPIVVRGAVFVGQGILVGILLIWLFTQYVLLPLDRTRLANIELAFYEPLTNLPNRRLLMDRLDRALVASARSQQFGALIILDLDHFKILNDTQGYDVGDCVLVEVSKRLVANVRAKDTVSCLGGDEYVVIVEDLGGDAAAAAGYAEMIAEKFHRALNQPYVISPDNQSHHTTPSIGLTLFRGHDVSRDVLFKQADLALYQAKHAGRNTIRFFSPEMQAVIESRSAMETALRHGLQEHEFQLFYQPQVDQDGQVTGAEALLRWMPAGKPAVPPDKFIPLAEDTGLIIPIGLWVMETACAQLRAWEGGAQDKLQIAVNVSACQFHQPDFVEQVGDVLRLTGANPSRLKLELTESVVLGNVEEVIEKMEQIRSLGVTFSLDDFGTGFSSLSYLKRLPLDQLKIDQSFVRDIPEDPNDAAIVRAIIAMSYSLGIQVIAEGVETEAQRDFLKENGCTHFQGYLFGKPASIGEWTDARSSPAIANTDMLI